MTLKKKIIISAVLLFVAILTGLFIRAWFYAADKVSRPEEYREYITKTVSEKLKRNVTYEKGAASLTLRDGLSMQMTNLIIKEKDGKSDFLKVDKASVRINLLPLLRNRLVFGELILHQPRVSLTRDSSGVLNIDDLLKSKEDENSPKFRKIIVENGAVAFLDQAAGSESLLTSLENFNGRFNALFWTSRYRFHIKTTVVENKNKAQLDMKGFFRSASADKPVYESKIRASIDIKGTDLKHYIPYLKKYTPMKQMAGKLNADITISGRFSDFKSKGSVVVKNGLLDYPDVFNDILQPRLVEVHYSMKRDKESLSIDVAHLAVNNFNAKGNFAMDDLDKQDPLLKASAITKVFSLKEVRPYVPWRIIPQSVSEFIQDYIKDGNFRLIEGKLKGRLSQIADINGKKGVDVLSIRAEADKAILKFSESTPAFNNISGILELKKRVFFLRKMNGRFGNSPLSLEGNISDFARPEPNIYTAYMKVQPVRDEVLWLLGRENFRDLSFKGNSMLFLSGSGTDEDYHINATWNLGDVAYAYPGVLEKPKGKKNTITAKLVINEDAIQFPSFQCFLPPMNLTATAKYRFSGEMPVSFNIQSKTFDVREGVPIFPVLRSFHPAGNCSVAVAGRGDLSNPSSILWDGNIAMANISFRPVERANPLKEITGKAFFRQRSMETSLLKGKIGNSYVQGNFRIDDLSRPRFIAQFHTNHVQTDDLGLASPEGNLNMYAVRGQVGVEGNIVYLDNISFLLGKSSFNVSGEVLDEKSTKLNVNLSSPYMESDDLAKLVSLDYAEKKQGDSSTLELNATLHVNDGKLNDIEFKQLYAWLKYSKGILDVENLEADIFEGKFKTKGKVVINADGRHHYETDLSINKMSLEKIQGYLDVQDRTISGTLSLTGELSTAGRNADELKKTASGDFNVVAEKGVLKKFSVLSKIFSMLNVFQLAKLQLPDMARGGMPYKKITFNTSLKDGVLSSKDFFIDSDAMQFSCAGDVDFIRKELGFVVGVHPLQSLDLLAAKIPIAGWVITDERGKLITFNFKVEGPWDDPKVTATTTQSIGKGTVDIFKRIFLLPEKLMTDTGEVILGH